MGMLTRFSGNGKSAKKFAACLLMRQDSEFVPIFMRIHLEPFVMALFTLRLAGGSRGTVSAQAEPQHSLPQIQTAAPHGQKAACTTPGSSVPLRGKRRTRTPCPPTPHYHATGRRHLWPQSSLRSCFQRLRPVQLHANIESLLFREIFSAKTLLYLSRTVPTPFRTVHISWNLPPQMETVRDVTFSALYGKGNE